MTRLLHRLLSSPSPSLASACGGQSAQDKAQSNVCSARADIKKQVDALKSTTLTSGSIDGVKANLSAIQKDVKQIADAQGNLSVGPQAGGAEGQRGLQVAGLRRGPGGRQRAVSGGSGQDQIKAAVQALAASYQSALAPIKC